MSICREGLGGYVCRDGVGAAARRASAMCGRHRLEELCPEPRPSSCPPPAPPPLDRSAPILRTAMTSESSSNPAPAPCELVRNLVFISTQQQHCSCHHTIERSYTGECRRRDGCGRSMLTCRPAPGPFSLSSLLDNKTTPARADAGDSLPQASRCIPAWQRSRACAITR